MNVREVMAEGCECIGESQSVMDAAKRLSELDVGSMPICGDDDKLKGMITDRDIAVKVVAKGMDPAATKTGELGEGKPVCIGADESIEDAMALMSEHQIRRLPVLDEKKRLCGIVSQADIAKDVANGETGDMVQAISA